MNNLHSLHNFQENMQKQISNTSAAHQEKFSEGVKPAQKEEVDI
jgi:hypothetical protein